MSLSNEIGGYFGLECGHTAPYHTGAVLLNSARNALRYIIRANHITHLFVPYYTCPVVWQALGEENVQLSYYPVNSKLEIDLKNIPQEAFVLVNNYFGIKGKYIDVLTRQYPNIIVDNAQAFFAPKQGLAAFYCPRKFFGLPDGGLAICDKQIALAEESAVSYNVCAHLLKRYDLSASAGYADFQENEKMLIGQPVCKMSKLTRALMGNIDYNLVRNRRLANFQILHQALAGVNQLNLDLSSHDVPMVYPLLIDKPGLRQKLIQHKIYVATYWPELEKVCPQNSFELTLQRYLLPLPIDQRYGEPEMKRMLEVLCD